MEFLVQKVPELPNLALTALKAKKAILAGLDLEALTEGLVICLLKKAILEMTAKEVGNKNNFFITLNMHFY